MRWPETWSFLSLHNASTLDVETARASLAMRAHQSVHAKWAVWVVCLVTTFTLWNDIPSNLILGWSLPMVIMAEVNWRVSRRVLLHLEHAKPAGLRDRQLALWWMTVLNQTAMGSAVWWFGLADNFELAAFATALQMVYLGAAMINAATHPPTFVAGACINLASAAAYWLLSPHNTLALVLALGLAALMAAQLSLQMAANLRDSLGMRFENEDLLRRLAEEKKNAEEATKFKSEFLATISHEVRTPVSAIMGMTYLTLKTELTERQREMLGVVHQCGQHLHALINQVLDFSKVEASMLKLEHRAFKLDMVLDTVLAMNADAATAKGLQLQVQIMPNTPLQLLGDPLRLTEILVNYLSNAIKFTDHGSVTLSVQCSARAARRVQLHASVEDTGVGITPEQMGRLFQTFSQADSSTTRRYGGTGLGLAIAKKLAELMGGEVGVHSAPQHGATFWFTAWLDLPLDAANPGNEGPTPTGASTAQANPQAAPAPLAVRLLDAPITQPPVDEGPPLSPAQAEEARQLLAHVQALAAQDDPDALTLLNAHRVLLRQVLGPSQRAIETALRAHDWPLAAQQLRGLGHEGTPMEPDLKTARNPLVLVVDDTPVNLTLMVDLLKPEYRVRTATRGARALAIARQTPQPDLVLLDVMMPEMDGYAVMAQLAADDHTRNIPVVFLTAKNQAEDEERGLALGALDYISKPISPPIVLTRVRTQLTLKAARDFLVDQSRYLTQEVERRTAEIKDIQAVTVLTMASLAETRDNETGQHILRTQRYVRVLARALQPHPDFAAYLTDEQIELLYQSAPLHDIGKVGIPDRILLKPERLDDDEMEVMKTHTTIGRDTIETAEHRIGHGIPFLVCAKQIAYSHQEKWDGSGYPQGLVGTAIPIAARLMALADVYDALISRRVYKPAFSHHKAVAIIREGRGHHFDPAVVDAFDQVEAQFVAIAAAFRDADTNAL